jgi:arsenate reductase (thioredoxin)
MGGVSTNARLRVLFLCTGNSCRSQMAEGWARHLKGDQIEAHSAGTRPQGLNPLAARVMQEVGVDISRQSSKDVRDLLNQEQQFDCIVTVCDSAAEACPVPPAEAHIVHAPFADPPRLAEGARSEAEALVHYRRVRDEIRRFVEGMPSVLRAQ